MLNSPEELSSSLLYLTVRYVNIASKSPVVLLNLNSFLVLVLVTPAKTAKG